MSIELQGALIDIRADQVPLMEILKAISNKTGLLVESGDPLEKIVSLNLKAVSVETCLQRLLVGRNFALTYKKTGDNRFVPVSVSIIGESLVKRLEPTLAAKPAPAAQSEPVAKADTPQEQQNDNMKKYEKSWFEQAVGGADGLAKQIDVELSEADAEIPGLRIRKVSPDSVFYKIGLREDDFIHDVNGKPIKTARELIQTLQSIPNEALLAPNQPRMIRIDRTGGTGRLPIYIELH